MQKLPLLLAMMLLPGALVAEETTEPAKSGDTIGVQDKTEQPKGDPRGDLRKLPATATEDMARKAKPPLIDLHSTTSGAVLTGSFVQQVPTGRRAP